MKYRETIDYPVPCERVLAKFARKIAQTRRPIGI